MSDDKAAIYHIVAFVLEGKGSAKQAVKAIKREGRLNGVKVAAHAVVSRDEKGKIHVSESGRAGTGAAVGAVTGGILALFGPAGILTWAIAGGAIGGVAGHYLGRPMSRKDLKQMGEALDNDTSAFMVLVEDKEAEAVIDELDDINATVVTLTLGNELSGEIAEYMAADVTDSAGDEVVAVAAVEAAVNEDGSVDAVGTSVVEVSVPEGEDLPDEGDDDGGDAADTVDTAS